MKDEEKEFKNDLPNMEAKTPCSHPMEHRLLQSSSKTDKLWFCRKCQVNFVEIQGYVKAREDTEIQGV